MTKFRKRPAQRFIAFLVEPSGDFNPTSWQDVPQSYRVIDYVGPKNFRGRADAWRFIENKTVLDQMADQSCDDNHEKIPQWAVVID